jgi:hypothetical protein
MMRVGPVLQAGPMADVIVAAIRALTPQVDVVDRGSYVRVLVPGRCRLTRAEVERRAPAPFRLPQDLEQVMSSFQGRFSVSTEEARWEA